jgi:NAD+ synthase
MTGSRDYAEVAEVIERWLRDYLKRSGCKGFVLGLSGGLDSSVVGALCRRVSAATIGLLLPCGHRPADAVADALLVAKQFRIDTVTYDLTPVYAALLQAFNLSASAPVTLPLANLKARLRMITLYYEANKRQALVVGTGDRTELVLGFFTKYGDGGVDLLPIGSLLKGEVRELAGHLGIPKHIIAKPPSPELWPGQTAEGELGASYDQLDALVAGATPKGLSSAQIGQLRKRIAINEHKLKLPPVCPL